MSAEDRLADAAEREMDLYRDEITRVQAARDEYRDNAILHIQERDQAREALSAVMTENRIRCERVASIAEGLERRAEINRPSKVSEICDGIAASLRKAMAGG